jgi:triphosphoribosyl-dephospho-CoA synthase
MPDPIAARFLASSRFLAACRAELHALKPGNVHVFAPGHGMDVHHFEQAAEAAAAVIATPDLGVGQRIRRAVDASLAAAGCNTNLGIILLCAPLIAAAFMPDRQPLRARLASVLDGLTIADAGEAFRAIAAANPGGLGSTDAADVRAPASIDLRAAMALAAARDRIAQQYVTGFADLFDIAVPALDPDPCAPHGVENAYLALLSAFADSHIVRKFGVPAAEGVRREAQEVREAIVGAAPADRQARPLAVDASLKGRGLNPGTTADLTVSSIFAALLSN